MIDLSAGCFEVRVLEDARHALQLALRQTGGGAAMMWTAVAKLDFQHASLRAYDMMLSSLWNFSINSASQVLADSHVIYPKCISRRRRG